jgi:hypothetical protein
MRRDAFFGDCHDRLPNQDKKGVIVAFGNGTSRALRRQTAVAKMS